MLKVHAIYDSECKVCFKSTLHSGWRARGMHEFVGFCESVPSLLARIVAVTN